MTQSTDSSVTEALVRGFLPKRRSDSHKGDYGRLLIVAGSVGMTGAAMMAVMAAMRTGSGLTTLAAPRSVVQMAAPHLMEAMTLPLCEDANGVLSDDAIPALGEALHGKTAVLAGCGMRVTDHTKQIVNYLMENTKGILVFDADALNGVSEDRFILKRAAGRLIVTPHVGEMARLTGRPLAEIAADPAEAARQFSVEYGCVTVLKSHRTVIAAPDGTVWRNTTGNAALAKGGSGDVLAGMIASFAAQGIEPEKAAVCAVWLHGFAADRLMERMSEYGVLARDLIGELPYAMKTIGS